MRRLGAEKLDMGATPTVIGAQESLASVSSVAVAAEADALRRAQQDAFDDARSKGFDAGKRDAEREIAQQVQKISADLERKHSEAVARLDGERKRLNELAQSISMATEHFAENAEATAVEVAYAAVIRLLGEKAVDRSLMVDLCRTIVREHGHPAATLRLSEPDFALLQDQDVGIPVEIDRRLSPGQCVIDSPRGQIESGLELRLHALTQALLVALAEHRAQP